jgi:hypothetical protein
MKETRNALGRHHNQHDPYTRHPVMTPDMIRQLPARYALIVRGGMSPVIARLPMAWTDPAYKRARRAGAATGARTIAEPAAQEWETPPPRAPWPTQDTWPDAIPPSAAWDDPERYPWQ